MKNQTFVAVEKRAPSVLTVFKWLLIVAVVLTIVLYIFY